MRFLIIILLLSVQMTNAQSYKVMTYNIRYDNPGDGVNSWSNRKEKVYALLKKYDPDILGIQEALHHQLKDISVNVSEYEWIGVGRDDGKEKGEYSAILYKKSRLEVLEQKTFWLSETPDVPGSKSWDAAITRLVTWIRFKDKATGKTFQVFNTHFDHIGKEARKNSAKLIQKWISELGRKYNEEAIVTGDFNIERTEEPYAVMMDGTNNLGDSKPESNHEGTFCNFGLNSQPCRGIDYIFTTKKWKTSDYMVIQDNDGKNYPSDHLPVMVTALLNR
jgi:endonuclease/exonuclease/phosphatase family metal-dependent hydrolase